MRAIIRVTGKCRYVAFVIITFSAVISDAADAADAAADVYRRFMMDNGATTLWESWKQETEVRRPRAMNTLE
jgi:hypothetical protein